MAPFFIGRGSARVHFEALADLNREFFFCVGPDASAVRQVTILACVSSPVVLREAGHQEYECCQLLKFIRLDVNLNHWPRSQFSASDGSSRVEEN